MTKSGFQNQQISKMQKKRLFSRFFDPFLKVSLFPAPSNSKTSYFIFCFLTSTIQLVIEVFEGFVHSKQVRKWYPQGLDPKMAILTLFGGPDPPKPQKWPFWPPWTPKNGHFGGPGTPKSGIFGVLDPPKRGAPDRDQTPLGGQKWPFWTLGGSKQAILTPWRGQKWQITGLAM